jgi:hypothetical protein
MKAALRRIAGRWLPAFEYSVGGTWLLVLLNGTILVVFWYAITEATLGDLLGPRWLGAVEYLFLPAIALFIGWRACRLRWELDKCQNNCARLKLPASTRLSSKEWKQLFGMAAEVKNGRLARFYKWMAGDIHGGKAAYTIQQLARSWHHRMAWLRALPFLGLSAFLASPWQYYPGHYIACGLDRLFTSGPWIVRGSKICYEDYSHGERSFCAYLDTEDRPGGLVTLKGAAPDTGYFLIRVRNWPRSGRRLVFSSEVLAGSSPILVHGSTARVKYRMNLRAFQDNIWAFWAEMDYLSWIGRPLQRADYSGNRFEVPPDSYSDGK